MMNKYLFGLSLLLLLGTSVFYASEQKVEMVAQPSTEVGTEFSKEMPPQISTEIVPQISTEVKTNLHEGMEVKGDEADDFGGGVELAIQNQLSERTPMVDKAIHHECLKDAFSHCPCGWCWYCTVDLSKVSDEQRKNGLSQCMFDSTYFLACTGVNAVFCLLNCCCKKVCNQPKIC